MAHEWTGPVLRPQAVKLTGAFEPDSQALVEAFSQGNCSDTEQSAQSNLSHTHKPCLLHDKTMEASRLSRFGMMCEPLTESLGVELLTWWLAAFPVKTYPQQEKAQESVEKEADCGQKWLGLLAKYDPDTHSLKTAQCSLVEDLTECSVTLPRWGSMRNGVVFQRPIVELGMRETGFGYLLPTVNTTGLDGGSNSRKAIKKRMLPTIVKQDSRHAVSRHINPKSNHWESNLGEVLVALTGLKKWSRNFAEWMMGWPIGHTVLQPLETDKYQLWLQQHGKSFQKD